MNLDPFVSIVIPVYNGANYLGHAIESALAQTYENIEVIVVDDGSDDGGATRSVAEGFGNRIRYISKPNGGVATALNAGIEAMRGELFSWLSHDDLYKPEKVARQVETWKQFRSPCVVIGDFEICNEQMELMLRSDIAGRNLIARPLDAFFVGLINGCTLLIPKEVFARVGCFEPGLPTTQDYHLWYWVAREFPFVHCPHADVRQRIHQLQGSRNTAHVREASRLFACLLDATPPEVMTAYEGSPLAFVLKVREQLAISYPGLRGYLEFRIGRLMKELRYDVVLLSDEPAGEREAGERLRAFSCPPSQIVKLDVPADRGIAALLRAADTAASADILLFLRAERLPSEPQLRAALETLVGKDADAARPSDAPVTASVLDGLIVRRGILSRLAEDIGERENDLKKGLTIPFSAYPVVDPFLAPTEDGIRRAFDGQVRIDFGLGLSEEAIANLLLEKLRPELPTILFLAHSLGGGTITHLAALMQAISGRANCLTAFGYPGGDLHLCWNSVSVGDGLVFRIPKHLPHLRRLLRRAGLRRIDVFHTMGFEAEAEALLDYLELPFDITLVDYHLIAKTPHLASEEGVFQGEGESALPRTSASPLLNKADRVIAISRDMAARVNRLCPGLPLITAFHWDEFRTMKVRHVLLPGLWGEEPLRVLLAGHIANHKGRELILAAALLAKERDLPLEFHVMGQIDVGQIDVGQIDDARPALTVHGVFAEGTFHEVLCGLAPHVAWLPSRVPETWSYVLSDFIEAAMPIAATSIGSFRERCHGRPFTWLLPLEWGAESWVEFFMELRALKLRKPAIWDSLENLPAAQRFYFDEYLSPGPTWPLPLA